jgi:2-dehydro-3-deoxyphosphogluconate aldolase / (4S)-4-hydroxy-2-oxoglutarate aldolase
MSDAASTRSAGIAEILALAPVVPVLTVEEPKTAVALARALVKGGLRALEITLRTDRALDAARAVIAEVEHAVVGLGTVLKASQITAASRLGARFAVSPGHTSALLDAAAGEGLPYLPGAATASEIMALLESGYTYIKFFPAEALGGIDALRGLAAPLRSARFCPTGGIDAEKAKAYLALPSVAAIGGSWVAPADRIAKGDWASIEALARQAAALRPATATAR